MTVTPQLSDKLGGILFIGEAPSDEEIIKGWPLVGPSGHYLDQALRKAWMVRTDDPRPGFAPNQRSETRRMLWARSDHSFTNVFNEQLPNNDVKNWCWSAKERQEWKDDPQRWGPDPGITGIIPYYFDLHRIGSSGYLRPEYYYHLFRLRREIEQCRPNLICPLGGTALWALTGMAAIDEMRGAIGVATLLAPGTKILPMFHPAFLFHSPKYLGVLISDLIKAQREVAYPEIRLPSIEIWLEPTLEDLDAYLPRIRNSKLVSIDIETGGGQISCVSFAPSSLEALVVPFVDYRKPDRSYWPTLDQEVTVWAWIRRVCEDPSIPKLFQNGGSFDIFWFLWTYGISMRSYREDTRIKHKVLYPELPAALKFLVSTYGNREAWKAGVKHNIGKRDD